MAYIIQPNDNLSTIAAKNGTTVQALMAANPQIKNANVIRAGQPLNLPGMAAAPPSIAQSTNPNLNIPVPQAVTPFESVLPYDKVFNPNLIQSLAESQVLPEINRQQGTSLQDYYRNLGKTGGFRSGVGIAQKQNIMDQFTRQGKEETGNFSNTINNIGTDWYNKLKVSYNQQPGMFTQNALPTFDQFLQQNPNLGNLYNQGTSTTNQYQNPFNF